MNELKWWWGYAKPTYNLWYSTNTKMSVIRKDNRHKQRGIHMDDGSYISLEMTHVNADGTIGESLTAEISQKEYEFIENYLMYNEDYIATQLQICKEEIKRLEAKKDCTGNCRSCMYSYEEDMIGYSKPVLLCSKEMV